MEGQTIVEIKEKIKRNELIRTLLSPVMNVKCRSEYNQYLESEDSKYFKQLKGQYQGRRCFIVCNGPSLVPSDLELIKNEYSFGFNRIYYIFEKTSWRPSFYMSVDKDVILMNNKEISELDIPLKFLDLFAKDHVKYAPSMHYMYMRDGFLVRPYTDKNIKFSDDLSRGYSDGGTVTYVSIQMAMHMGFDEIYILGADHNYSTYRKADGKTYKDNTVENYFEGLKSTGITGVDIDRTTKAYELAKKECERRNIIIRNATRGGKLEVFERINLEDIIK